MDWRVAWRAKRDQSFKEPHFASAETTLKPQNIDTSIVGEHVSVPFVRGTRHYLFEGQKNRDRFVNLYRPFGAKPCKDPCP